ncbi:MAG: polyamine ABC transporter substrate-binding protein [Gammaproteobacteria bacterium]
MHTPKTVLLAAILCAFINSVRADNKVVHVYNWSDYIAPDTLENFQSATGIKVTYDVYDSNEVMEAKLLAGGSGYDVVFPTAQPFAERQIKAGLYQKLDKSKLGNYGNLDPTILKPLQTPDPDNAHVVPYMWGTSGIGYNVDKVKAILGDNVPTDTWALLFDPAIASKLAGCGISVMDDEMEGMSAALMYLGKDPNSTDPKDFEAAVELFKKVRPYIKYFHSSQYINDLANGDLCVAHGYSGDVLQARDRADEAGNNVHIAYAVPTQGAILWIDVMAIPTDAPHTDNAYAFINYLLKPDVIATISNEVTYANANRAATGLIDEAVRDDPGVYPPEDVKQRLVTIGTLPDKVQRLKVRAWTRIKSGQ